MTGCRKGELLGLEWSRVDFDANVIRLRESDTKAGSRGWCRSTRRRTKLSGGRLKFREKRCPDASGCSAVLTESGIAAVKSSFRHACRSAGIAGMRFHDLRHTCGPGSRRQAFPEGHIAAVLGHSTVRMNRALRASCAGEFTCRGEKLTDIPKRIPSGHSGRVGKR